MMSAPPDAGVSMDNGVMPPDEHAAPREGEDGVLNEPSRRILGSGVQLQSSLNGAAED